MQVTSNQVNSSYVFCPPLPGKPNPNEPCVEEQNRSRVKLSPQKGSAAEFTAFQILRDEKKIGKHPSPLQLEKREIEIFLSVYRKQITEIDNVYKPIIEFANQVTAFLKGRCPRAAANKFYLLNKEELKPVDQLAIQRYCNQDKFDEFLFFVNEKYCLEKTIANEKLFEKLGISNKVNQNFKEKHEKPQSLTPNFDKVLYDKVIINKLMCSSYGIKNSPWHPEDSIDQLIEQLQLHGPHFIAGSLGQRYCKEKALQISEIDGRPILGWSSESQISKPSAAHCAILVGADKNKNLVYFIDPIDGSDPNPQSQKIYAVSYEILTSQITTLENEKASDLPGNVFTPKKKGNNNFALHI